MGDQRFKGYLVQGYAINERRLEQKKLEVQTMKGEEDFYPSLEEKAATLYLIVKNRGFVDGNIRIAAACFLLFLEKNRMVYIRDREPIISNDALASLTLFVPASKPESLSRRRPGKWKP